MKRYLTLILPICILLSCEKVNDAIVDNSYLWIPIVEIIKGDGKATLFLTNPAPFSNCAPPCPSNPDYFKIMISDDLQHFSLYKIVNNSTSNVLIENLTNDKPYYFLVTSHKEKFDVISISDTLMTIPSEESNLEPYLTTINYSVKKLSTSYDLSYISFKSNDYIDNYGKDMLYYKASVSNAISIVEENAYNPGWSKTKNQFVYLTSKQEGVVTYPFLLKLFDAETKISTTLFEIQYDDYYVINPTFKPDGETITFFSSKGNSDIYTYDLWKINPVTKEQTKITNFEAIGFITDSKYEWIASGEEIYLEGRYIKSNKNDIYKFNISTKLLIPVIKSCWEERTPFPSPDNTKIAFISDRTGNDELWIYELVNSKYKQVTGESSYDFDSRYSYIQWLNNDQILITVFKDIKSIAVKINVN